MGRLSVVTTWNSEMDRWELLRPDICAKNKPACLVLSPTTMFTLRKNEKFKQGGTPNRYRGSAKAPCRYSPYRRGALRTALPNCPPLSGPGSSSTQRNRLVTTIHTPCAAKLSRMVSKTRKNDTKDSWRTNGPHVARSLHDPTLSAQIGEKLQ